MVNFSDKRALNRMFIIWIEIISHSVHRTNEPENVRMTGLLRLTNLLEDGAALLGNYPLQPLTAANGSTCSPSCLCMSPAYPQNVPCMSLMCLLCVPSVGPSFAPRHILCHPSPNPGPIMTGHPLHASHGIKDFTHHRPQSQIHCPATCTRDCQKQLVQETVSQLDQETAQQLV